jgi:hypothetical protein
MVDVVAGIYHGRPYVATLTDGGVWVVRSEGPVLVFPALTGEQATAIRDEVERLFDALPESAPSCIESSQRSDTGASGHTAR